MNPLFPADNPDPGREQSYVLKREHGSHVQPPSQKETPEERQAALSMIRRKLDALYEHEPDSREELETAAESTKPLSKHQQYMQTLSTSGKSLADIQSAWHTYYQSLPDNEKHQVWQEFYQANTNQPSAYTKAVHQQSESVRHEPEATTPQQPAQQPRLLPTLPTDIAGEPSKHGEQHKPVVVEHQLPSLPVQSANRTRRKTKAAKNNLLRHIRANAETQRKAKQHFKSLLVGVTTGMIVLVVFLFSFFNEMFIAPFIQPSRHASATPIIMDTNSVAPGDTPEVIIPKINVEIPTIYDLASSEEAVVQEGLERGVIHYPSTVLPGQQGNAAYFGHSSNNIFNKGKYKFAFVLLRQLVPGDIFYLTHGGKVYAYRVFFKKVVPPSEVSVLNDTMGKTATATLITCDPPGTTTNRMVIWGEQISPDPATAAEAPVDSTSPETPEKLTTEGPTLWNRIWNAIF